ncbi:MAG: radical SAM protein [Thermoplasmata archaeon]
MLHLWPFTSLEAAIIVTYRCNARCKMCNTWQYPTTPEDEITAEHLVSLPKLRSINITGGEPFLRKDLDSIISVLLPKTKRLVISTNGYFTERILEVAKKFPEIGIRVSIEGLPKANDELRGIKDGFDHGLRTLINLRQMGFRDIGFGITVSDKNAKDLLELYHLAKMMGMEFATAIVHNSYYFHKFDNRIEDPEFVAHQFEKLAKEMKQSRRPKDWFRAYFNLGLANRARGGMRPLPCRALTDFFFIDPLGEVRPCNVMEESIGNIKTHTFKELW